jgi:hypothetical protein
MRAVAGWLLCLLLAWPVDMAHGQDAEPEAAPEQPKVEVTRVEKGYTVVAEDAPLGEVLARLREVSGIAVDLPQDLLSEKITLNLEGVSYEQLVKQLAGSHALVYELDPETGQYQLVSARLTSTQDALLELRKLGFRERRNVARKAAEAKKAIDEIGNLYGYAGTLNWDEAKALIQQRQNRFDELVNQLAQLGPGGARAIRDVYAEGGNTRQMLALVKALASVEDDEAAQTLGALFKEEETFSLLREMLASLGYRSDSTDVIIALLAEQDDIRLKAAGTMALAGKPDALDELTAMINSVSEETDIRKEAIRSVGEIGTGEAQQALAAVALSPMEVSIRQASIQELARTYGEEALPTFEVLLSDPDERIRYNDVSAIGRIKTDAAVALLQQVATEDPSESVRMRAEAFLPEEAPAPAEPALAEPQ